MSTRAVSLKSREESTFKDGISEYHTVDEDESGVLNYANKYQRPDNHKPEETGISQANKPKNYSESKFSELKTQIQSIFDDYNKNMGDFELFKSNFYLTMDEYKQQVESSVEGIIEHDSNESDGEIENLSSTGGLFNESNEIKNIETTLYSFNNNFVNFTSDEASLDSKNNSEKTFILNSDVVDPCIERDLSTRGTMSENYICEKIVDKASVQNIRTICEKTTEPQDSEQEENSDEEKYIPIKNTRAKEDLKKKQEDIDYHKDQDTLFIFKICSYICKKIRRNPIA